MQLCWQQTKKQTSMWHLEFKKKRNTAIGEWSVTSKNDSVKLLVLQFHSSSHHGRIGESLKDSSIEQLTHRDLIFIECCLKQLSELFVLFTTAYNKFMCRSHWQESRDYPILSESCNHWQTVHQHLVSDSHCALVPCTLGSCSVCSTASQSRLLNCPGTGNLVDIANRQSCRRAEVGSRSIWGTLQKDSGYERSTGKRSVPRGSGIVSPPLIDPPDSLGMSASFLSSQHTYFWLRNEYWHTGFRPAGQFCNMSLRIPFFIFWYTWVSGWHSMALEGIRNVGLLIWACCQGRTQSEFDHPLTSRESVISLTLLTSKIHSEAYYTWYQEWQSAREASEVPCWAW